MLVKTETIEFSRAEYFTARNDNDEFIVVAYGKVVAIVAKDGTVFKRLKACVGALGMQVDLSLQKVSGKRDVVEMSEMEWKSLETEWRALENKVQEASALLPPS